MISLLLEPLREEGNWGHSYRTLAPRILKSSLLLLAPILGPQDPLSRHRCSPKQRELYSEGQRCRHGNNISDQAPGRCKGGLQG